jgi:hypothetical protein
MDFVLTPGPYSAAVTFFWEFWVQTNLEECILDACSACWDDAPLERVAERLLNHRDQRFRLSYALGQWREGSKSLDEDDWSFASNEKLNLPTRIHDEAA